MNPTAVVLASARAEVSNRRVPLTIDELRSLHRKPVMVVSQRGTTISIGRILVSAAPLAEVALRLDLEFETEAMRCVLRVPLGRMRELLSSWDGHQCRYTLPAGEQVWRTGRGATPPLPQGEPVIETFPLPDAQ